MEGRLDGTAAWVTGGGSGIGRASAVALARLGARVFVSGRRPGALAETVAAARSVGGSVVAVPLDVSEPNATAAGARTVLAADEPLQTLVCSAGTNVARRAWADLTAVDFERVVGVNLSGTTSAILAVLPRMRAQGGGVVVAVSSWAGWTHSPGAGAAYSASKTALGALVTTLNDQEGRHGIRACHLCPGEVATDILRTRPNPPPADELRRMLRADDVARVVAFVATAPPHVCLNEVVVTPTWNRSYIGIPEEGTPR